MVCLALTVGFLFLYNLVANIKKQVSVTSLGSELFVNLATSELNSGLLPMLVMGSPVCQSPIHWDLVISILTYLGPCGHLTPQLLEKRSLDLSCCSILLCIL